MIKQITIKIVKATDRNKDGVEYEGKYGKFWRVGLLTEEFEDQWLNGFTSKEPTWEVGEKIDLDITTEETEKYGKQLKFRVPKAEDLKDAEIERLKKELENKKEDDPADFNPF